MSSLKKTPVIARSHNTATVPRLTAVSTAGPRCKLSAMTSPAAKNGTRAEFRLVAGLAMTPLTAGVVMFATFLALWSVGLDVFHLGLAWDPIDPAIALALGAGLLAIPLTGAAAVAVVGSRQDTPLTLSRVLVIGAGVGCVPVSLSLLILLFQQLQGTGSSPASLSECCNTFGLIRNTLLGLWVGVASAFVFWLVGVRRRG